MAAVTFEGLCAARAARRGLVSWETIGRVFSTSGEAAQDRFARLSAD